MAQHLAHEERVAVGLAVHGMGEVHRGLIEGVPGRGFHHCHDPGVIEPGELDTSHPELSMHGGEGLEERMGVRQLVVAVGPEHQNSRHLIRPDHVTQQLQAPGVRPLQIVENEDDGLVFRQGRQQSHHRREEQVALGVCVAGLQRREVGDSGGECRYQPGQLGSVGLHMCDELVLGGVAHVVAERLGEELIGGGKVLFTVPEQHTGTAVECGPGGFRDKRRLAQAGLTRDEEHLPPLAPGDSLGRVCNRLQLRLAPDNADGGADGQWHRQGVWRKRTQRGELRPQVGVHHLPHPLGRAQSSK